MRSLGFKSSHESQRKNLQFSCRVIALSAHNQMDATSISIVVGSCFFSETLSDTQCDNIVLMTKIPSYLVEIMLENSDKIFAGKNAIKCLED